MLSLWESYNYESKKTIHHVTMATTVIDMCKCSNLNNLCLTFIMTNLIMDSKCFYWYSDAKQVLSNVIFPSLSYNWKVCKMILIAFNNTIGKGNGKPRCNKYSSCRQCLLM